MKLANNVSVWAARYPRHAVSLIIVLELTNAIIGIIVGSALFCTFPPWVLMLMLLGVVLMNSSLKRFATVHLIDLPTKMRFGFQKQLFFALFCINLCAYTIAGGIMGRMANYPEGSNNLYGSISSISEKSKTTSDEQKITFSSTLRQKLNKQKRTVRSGDAGRRAGYIALFILGIVLAVVGAYLACGIACSGYGFAAVLVLLLSTGVLAGGIYFLGRVIDKNMKPFKTMTRDERKREGRRYLRTLLGTIGGMALLVLISSLSN